MTTLPPPNPAAITGAGFGGENNPDMKQFEGHTPEPWRVVKMDYKDTVYIVGSDGNVLAISVPTTGDETDCHLMAAAPTLLRQRNELLQALDKIKARVVYDSHILDVIHEAKQAINNFKNEE